MQAFFEDYLYDIKLKQSYMFLFTSVESSKQK